MTRGPSDRRRQRRAASPTPCPRRPRRHRADRSLRTRHKTGRSAPGPVRSTSRRLHEEATPGTGRIEQAVAYVGHTLYRFDRGGPRPRGFSIRSSAMETLLRTGSPARLERAGRPWTEEAAQGILLWTTPRAPRGQGADTVDALDSGRSGCQPADRAWRRGPSRARGRRPWC